MKHINEASRIEVTLQRPAAPENHVCAAFAILPIEASERLPRRGRTTVAGTLNDCPFQVTLEPDGKLSHWLPVSGELLEAAAVEVGDVVVLKFGPVAKEPEPELPADMQEALAAAPDARAVWESTTTIARVDWIHWVTSAKRTATRAKRIRDACEMLADGKKRVCCFDQSGFYSKALRAPKPAI